MSSQQGLIWSCKCGDIQANLSGGPLAEFNCHCRSCVAGARFIAGKTNNSGTPIIDDSPSIGGGVCVALFAANQVTFIKDLSSDTTTNNDDNDNVSGSSSKLKFIRIGENGGARRCYTACCGTQMTNFIHPNLIVFNRNGLQNTADGSKYQSKEVPINGHKSNAFDPAAVPEPSHEVAPPSIKDVFMSQIMNPSSTETLGHYKELFPDVSEADVVPITWE